MSVKGKLKYDRASIQALAQRTPKVFISGDFKDKERGIYILYKLVFILGFYLCTPLNVQGYSIGFFEKWTQRGEIWSYILILGLIFISIVSQIQNNIQRDIHKEIEKVIKEEKAGLYTSIEFLVNNTVKAEKASDKKKIEELIIVINEMDKRRKALEEDIKILREEITQLKRPQKIQEDNTRRKIQEAKKKVKNTHYYNKYEKFE